jgi:hypothetical protein
MPLDADVALEELCAAVRRAQELLGAVVERTASLQAERQRHRSFTEIVAAEERPLVVEMLSQVLEELAATGAAFRRAEARALSVEGMSHEGIAALFGVTRQRVGALLSPRRA